MKVVAEALGVSRSNLHERVSGRTEPRRRYHKAQDAAVAPLITALVATRPTYGYRRIAAILNRQRRTEGLAPVNHKRVYRIMQANSLLLRGELRDFGDRTNRKHARFKYTVAKNGLDWLREQLSARLSFTLADARAAARVVQ